VEKGLAEPTEISEKPVAGIHEKVLLFKTADRVTFQESEDVFVAVNRIVDPTKVFVVLYLNRIVCEAAAPIFLIIKFFRFIISLVSNLSVSYTHLRAHET
jgi:hypothetical protein